jgi:hypothetical protein
MFLDFGEHFNADLRGLYLSTEGKPINHTDAEFHEGSEKMGLTGLNRMRLADKTEGAPCATCLVSCNMDVVGSGSGEQPNWQ